MKKSSMIGAVLVTVVTSLVFGTSVYAAEGDAAKGKLKLVQHGCWECHGFNGQGSILTSGGRVLAPNPLPWETFSAYVRSPGLAMPPFSKKILPDSDLRDIYAYLESMPKTADYKTIPLLMLK